MTPPLHPPQVGDFHRTLLYGGIYGYPGDAKNTTGKLRLLYECAPMSMIAEQAGGLGSTGTERVLDVVPTKVHQRVPLFVGSKKVRAPLQPQREGFEGGPGVGRASGSAGAPVPCTARTAGRRRSGVSGSTAA